MESSTHASSHTGLLTAPPTLQTHPHLCAGCSLLEVFFPQTSPGSGPLLPAGGLCSETSPIHPSQVSCPTPVSPTTRPILFSSNILQPGLEGFVKQELCSLCGQSSLRNDHSGLSSWTCWSRVRESGKSLPLLLFSLFASDVSIPSCTSLEARR